MAEKNTTHYALPYPTSAGEVKNGATDIAELALALDTLLYSALMRTENAYGAQFSATSGTPSGTRMVQVTLEIRFGGATGEFGYGYVEVGGVKIGQVLSPSFTGESATQCMTFLVPANNEWKYVNGQNTVQVLACYLEL